MVGYVEAHPGDARTLTQRTKEIPMTIPVALDTCWKSHHVEYLLRVYENHGNGVFWQARKVSRSGYPVMFSRHDQGKVECKFPFFA